ncbi:MAG: LysR family transcriptional regulator [Eubacterium sp.]|nr:LysR family transcriptional regulator [Eubacterium sp.]
MELHQLQYFLAVANCGKITDASEMLHVSQSAISMSISRLEKELGANLFEKKGRQLYLTQNGQRFRDLISAAVAEINHAKNEIKKVGIMEPDVISMSVEMPDFSTRFQNLYMELNPNVIFKQSMDSTETARYKMQNLRVDFCIAFEPFNEADIISIPLLNERVCIQLSQNHPLANRSTVRLEEFKDDVFVSFSPEYSFRLWTDGMCFFAGFRPKICFEVCDTQSLLFILAKRNAVTFITESTSEIMGPVLDIYQNYVTIPLENNHCRRNVYLCYHKNRIFSPTAQDFIKFAQKYKELYANLGSIYQVEREMLSAAKNPELTAQANDENSGP